MPEQKSASAMPDLGSELIPFAAVAKSLPSSRGAGHVHVATLHRWRRHGVGGVKLGATRIGGAWYVRREQLQEFLEALNSDAPSSADATPAARSARRRAEIEAAQKALESEGI